MIRPFRSCGGGLFFSCIYHSSNHVTYCSSQHDNENLFILYAKYYFVLHCAPERKGNLERRARSLAVTILACRCQSVSSSYPRTTASRCPHARSIHHSSHVFNCKTHTMKSLNISAQMTIDIKNPTKPCNLSSTLRTLVSLA